MKILAFKDPGSNTYDVYTSHNDCLHNRYKFRRKLHSFIVLKIAETLYNYSDNYDTLSGPSDTLYEPLSSGLNIRHFQTLSHCCELGVGSTSMRQLKEGVWILS